MSRERGAGKVLFVGHGAERTGPPIGLLHLLRWIAANTDIDFEVLLLEGGDLLPDYQALAPVTVLHEGARPARLAQIGQALAEKHGATRLGDRLRVWSYRRRLRHLRGFRTIYCNSAWTIRAVDYVPMTEQTLVVAAVHELSVGIEFHLSDQHRWLLCERPDHYLVVSGAVYRYLVDRHGVDPDRISLHHEMIAIERDPPDRTPDRPGDRTFVVGGSGLLRWRKGPDLFLAIAAEVRRRRPDLDIQWDWIGGLPDDPDLPAIEFDRARAGLDDVVAFLGHVDDPIERYAELDLLVLTSREDAYPLVCLESASVGVPVLTFVNGGMPEFVSGAVDALDDPRAAPPFEPGAPAGAVVAFPDIRSMADAVIALVDDADRRLELGARGAARVRRWHAVDVAAPRLVADLAEWLSATPVTVHDSSSQEHA